MKQKNDTFLQDIEKIKLMAAKHGVNWADFARRNNLKYNILYDVLCGRNRGTRGEGFKVLQALKLAPTKSPKLFR